MLKVMILSLLLLFSGCSCKTKIEYIEEKPYTFQKLEQPKARTIRVHPEDKPLLKAFIGKFRDGYDFFNSQIDDYYKAKGKL